MIGNTNAVIDKLDDIVSSIKASASQVGSSSEELSDMANQISQTAEDVSNAVLRRLCRGFNQSRYNRVLAPSAVVHLDRTQYRVIPVFERDDVVLVGIVSRGVGLVS